MRLSKKSTLFERDEEGNLIAQEIPLETLKNKGDKVPTIKATPMLKGELQKMFQEAKNGDTNKQQDKEIILNHCVEPSYSDEEIDDIKPKVAGAIVTAILSISLDVEQGDIEKQSKEQLIKNAEVAQKKN